MLWNFFNPKKYNYLKSLFKHLKIIIFKNLFRDIFNMSYIIMIWNWKWKKMLFSISFKYSYFKPIFKYSKKKLWKWSLICHNCDSLMCFCLKTFDDQKKKIDAKNISQPRSLGIPHHIKTIAGGGTMTHTSCKNSKPKTCGQTRTIVKRSGYSTSSIACKSK
jgi:hypothetical protein